VGTFPGLLPSELGRRPGKQRKGMSPFRGTFLPLGKKKYPAGLLEAVFQVNLKDCL